MGLASGQLQRWVNKAQKGSKSLFKGHLTCPKVYKLIRNLKFLKIH